LRGSVTDSSGVIVTGAQIVLENLATGFRNSRITNSDGGFQFLQIPSAGYTVSVSKNGFAPQSKKVELPVNQPTTISFLLSVQAVSTIVVVNAGASSLNLVDASMGDAVNRATIEALPMEGRNVPELLSLQPGVLYLGSGINQSHDSRSGASAGGRSDQGNITLDGVDNNDQVRGYAFSGVLRATLDSVAEFRVTTAGFGADTGRSSGAQVTLLTRSGTNKLSGSIYEYNRNSLGEANNWFNKQAELGNGRPNVPAKLVHNTFGVSMGGPIKKNKAFAFVNYEGQRAEEGQQETLTVPSASMRAGAIQYPHTVAGVTTNVELSPAQIAQMDPKCSANGTCPWGAGVDPYVLAVLNEYPASNSVTAGDGLNTASYTWSAPSPKTLNTYIARLDFTLSRNQWIFVRGNLQNDRSSEAPQFPGKPASSAGTDNSKGFVVGYTWNLSPNIINNLHYAFTRQGYSSRGIGQGQYANFGS
jgi:hypothetical protein